MAISNLGRVHEIWQWPFHYFVAVRHEYLRIVNPPAEPEEKKDVHEIAPGITVETISR